MLLARLNYSPPGDPNGENARKNRNCHFHWIHYALKLTRKQQKNIVSMVVVVVGINFNIHIWNFALNIRTGIIAQNPLDERQMKTSLITICNCYSWMLLLLLLSLLLHCCYFQAVSLGSGKLNSIHFVFCLFSPDNQCPCKNHLSITCVSITLLLSSAGLWPSNVFPKGIVQFESMFGWTCVKSFKNIIILVSLYLCQNVPYTDVWAIANVQQILFVQRVKCLFLRAWIKPIII